MRKSSTQSRRNLPALTPFPQVTDAALLSLVARCTGLRSVDIADCKNLSVLADLRALVPGCHFDT